MSRVVYNFLKQFIVSRLEQFVNRDGVSVIQVPKTSAAPQDNVQLHPVSGRAQARPGWRTVGQPGNHCGSGDVAVTHGVFRLGQELDGNPREKDARRKGKKTEREER